MIGWTHFSTFDQMIIIPNLSRVQTQYNILNYERNMVEKSQCGSVYSVANEHVIKFQTDKSYEFN